MNRVSLLILGLIHDHPQSAYDLVKEIHKMGISAIFPCGESTIYIYSKKLSDKGLIEKAGSDANGKKTIYQITANGTTLLTETVAEITTQYEIENCSFSIAAVFLDIFPTGKRCDLLRQRIESVKQTLFYLHERKEHITQEAALPKYHAACMERLMHIAEGELDGCLALLDALKQEERK